jgi:hypothetical protein
MYSVIVGASLLAMGALAAPLNQAGSPAHYPAMSCMYRAIVGASLLAMGS